MSEDTQKCSIVVFSGDMDKVLAPSSSPPPPRPWAWRPPCSSPSGACKAIQKGTPTGKGLFGRMLGLMNRGGIDRIGPSR